MNATDRYKMVIRYLIGRQIAPSQKELGKELGYNNESTFSQIINGRIPAPKKFKAKLKEIEPSLNIEWLETGKGNMLINGVAGNNNTSVAGNNNTVNESATIEKAIDEISEMRKLLQKAVDNNQLQFDKFIELITNLTK